MVDSWAEVIETPWGLHKCVGAPFSSLFLLSRRAHYQEGVVPIDLIDESEQQACTDIQVLHPRDPYQHTVLHLWPKYTWQTLQGFQFRQSIHQS